jgi:GABA(A) receptor-associated protein
MFNFEKTHKFEDRLAESTKIRNKYPDRIPVIVERNPNTSNIPNIDKNKFLVPGDLTVGQFLYVIRKRIKLNPEQAIFIFINGKILPSTSALMSNLYKDYKTECGYLFVNYAGESTFG